MTRPNRCEICEQKLVLNNRGRVRKYCSDRCRSDAYRRRQGIDWRNLYPNVSTTPVPFEQAPILDQVTTAILTARAAASALIRIGEIASPNLAWRCSKSGQEIIHSIAINFDDKLNNKGDTDD